MENELYDLNVVLKDAVNNFGTYSDCSFKSTLILPDGSYLNIETNSDDVEKWLNDQGVITDETKCGCPTLLSAGCIDCNVNEPNITLPRNVITSNQLDALSKWVDCAFANKDSLGVVLPNNSQVAINNCDDLITNISNCYNGVACPNYVVTERYEPHIMDVIIEDLIKLEEKGICMENKHTLTEDFGSAKRDFNKEVRDYYSKLRYGNAEHEIGEQDKLDYQCVMGTANRFNIPDTKVTNILRKII